MMAKFRIRGIRQKFDDLLNDVGNYVICFGFWRGLVLFISSKLRPGSEGVPKLVSVPKTGLKLVVRPGTSDVSVFVDTFHHLEHEWGFCSEP